MENHTAFASGKERSGRLIDRPDSVSYAVGLLLGRQIKDSIAGYDPELFRYCFLAGSREPQTNSETEDIVHRLVADYRKQHPDAPNIAESELQVQVMSAYILGTGSMMTVMVHLLFDEKPGNPEVLCDGVLSGAELNPAGRESEMDFEECRVYLESGPEESVKNALETLFEPVTNALETLSESVTASISAAEADAVADTLPDTGRKAGNYRAIPLQRAELEKDYTAYQAAHYKFYFYDDRIEFADAETKEVRARFCSKFPQTGGEPYQRSRVCYVTLFEPEVDAPILLTVDRTDGFDSTGSLLFTIENAEAAPILHYAGELKLRRPYGDDKPEYTSGIISVTVEDGGGIRLSFGSGKVVYDPQGMCHTVPAEAISYLYDGDTLRLEGAILQDKQFRLNLLYALVDSEGGAKDNTYAYGDIDGDGHEDLVYLPANDSRRVSVLLLENSELRERILLREELPYTPFIAVDETCMIRDGILTLWEDTEAVAGKLPPYHRYRLRAGRLEPVTE
ncbi:MAG: FKBP-type peptidyl-prolyl cis-trans isomerase N-terminal domain-containing protein [Parabacteroides sp.]|nr:FKBP-type peptidyl-prolyl cis-trans isomerase N-terminal domain-containing protein [Parabacteroides sp.]